MNNYLQLYILQQMYKDAFTRKTAQRHSILTPEEIAFTFT